MGEERFSYMPIPDEPDDFDRFWDQALDELSGYRTIEADVAEIKGDHPGGSRVFTCRYTSLDDVGIHAWLTMPRDGASSLVVNSHGYSSNVDPWFDLNRDGHAVFSIDVRGHGRSVGQIDPGFPGFATYNLLDPRNFILRGAYCDFLLGIDVAKQVEGLRDVPLFLFGGSFSGGLVTIAAGLRTDIVYTVAKVPTFGHFPMRRTTVKGGSGDEINRWISENPLREDDVMRSLNYFDACHFARRASSPVLMGIGADDPVVPPETVQPIYDCWKHPDKELMTFPRSHSGEPDEDLEWAPFEKKAFEIFVTKRDAARRP